MTDSRREPGINELDSDKGNVVELSGNLKLNPAFFAGKLPEPEKYNPSKAFRWVGLGCKIIFWGSIIASVVLFISLLFQ